MEPQADHPRILVVEDDPDLRNLWVAVLQDMGCVVTAVSEGAEACRAIETFRPRLMLLDLVMPGAELDGFDVLLRTEQSGVPVIVVSALGRELRETLGRRVAAVLPKPLDVYELMGEVKRQLSPSGSSA